MAGSISSLGIGSGLDANGIISSIMNVEKLPLNKLQSAATEMQTRLSAFGQIQSLVASFRDATAPLFAGSTFTATSATSSDSASIAATSSTTALPGNYNVSVQSLSSTQSNVSAEGHFDAATDAVGTGTITLRLGSWSADQSAFTAKAGSSDIVIPIGAGEGTLAVIRDKINAAGAGVNAEVIVDSGGARLALQSTSPGAENGFRVTVNDDDGKSVGPDGSPVYDPASNADGAGLSRLAFDPQNGVTRLARSQAAADSRATINGIEVKSSGNTVTSIQGLSLTLNKVTSSPVSISVARNTEGVKTMLASFVASYNALNTTLAAMTKYDPAAKAGALLQGDATATGLQNQLRAQIGEPGKASTAFSTLSSIGIEFQKDGSLKINDNKLAKALANLPELTKALSAVDVANPANNGFAKKLTTWADALLSNSGTLPGKTRSIQSQIESNQKAQDRYADRLSDIEARLKKQYSALDQRISSANALNQYVSQQITTWNKSER